ncbi:zinc-finger homeodomain protein 9-like protein [Tanacetum coccineum]
MDISPPPSTTVTTAATTVKTPDPESEPPKQQQQLIPPPFTNGVLKRHKPFNHHQLSPPIVVTYKECLKNHAATMGGHAVDGCGEFMPSPSSSPSIPTSLKCAACGCHRNFHRRDHEHPPSPPPIQHLLEYQPHHRHQPPPPPLTATTSPLNSPSPPPISSSYYPSSAPHMLLALGSETNNHNHYSSPMSGKKRFRTKFTQAQKEKMHEIASKVGWKMQKRDEDLINGFCNEIGVDRNCCLSRTVT